MSNHTTLSRRNVLKALGGTAVVAGAGVSMTGGAAAQMESSVQANAVTVTSDDGNVEEVYIDPVSAVVGEGFDVPVTKARQLVMAQVKKDGDVLTPSDDATPQTQNGWWPIFRESPWLFTTDTGKDAGLPISNEAGMVLDGEGGSISLSLPEGSISADETPNRANHAEVFYGNWETWQTQIRYATGSDANVAYEGWSYQHKGDEGWTQGVPAGVSASRNGDTITITVDTDVVGGALHAGAHLTVVGGDAGSMSYSLAATGAERPWDNAGLVPIDGADFEYGDDPAVYAQADYMNKFSVSEDGTDFGFEYNLYPSSGPNAGEGPIYVAKEGEQLPGYDQRELEGTSVGHTPARLNGSYGAVGGTSRFDNGQDGTDRDVTVKIGILTTLHTDYDFAENVPIPDDDNPDRLSPLAMGNSGDVGHAFGENTHAIPYEDLLANYESHPAVDWTATEFTVTAENLTATSSSDTLGNSGGE